MKTFFKHTIYAIDGERCMHFFTEKLKFALVAEKKVGKYLVYILADSNDTNICIFPLKLAIECKMPNIVGYPLEFKCESLTEAETYFKYAKINYHRVQIGNEYRIEFKDLENNRYLLKV